METCSMCGHQLQKGKYVRDAFNGLICLDCCTKIDLKMLHEEEALYLFLDEATNEICNVPKTLKFETFLKEGKVLTKNSTMRYFYVDEILWKAKRVEKNSNLMFCEKILQKSRKIV